ncbi:MAG: hypothetical protein J5525_13165 [Lachnospiraceae bacterium]|nr:hypothetical protein [Lachnospiraceae bacterium]
MARVSNAAEEPNKKNFKTSESYSHDDVIEMYSKAIAAGGVGTQEWKDYCAFVCDRLSYYIVSKLTKLHRTQGAEMSDLQQEVYAGIIKKLPEYDPYQSTLTSYFDKPIIEFSKAPLSNQQSGHYLNTRRVLDATLKLWGYDTTCADPNLDADIPVRLSLATSIPLTTIRKTIEGSRIHVMSIDEHDNTLEVSSKDTPEEAAIKREKAELILKAMDETLTPLEKEVLTQVKLNENMSFVRLKKAFDTNEEYRKQFECYLPSGQKKLQQNFLRNTYLQALDKMKHCTLLHPYAKDYNYVIKEDPYGDVEDMIATEDMDSFMDTAEDI